MVLFYVGSLISIIACYLMGFVIKVGGSSNTDGYFAPVVPSHYILDENQAIFFAIGLVVFFFIVSGINMVSEWDRRPYMKFGKYQGELGPGLGWINPLFNYTLEDVFVNDEVTTMDIKNVQTKDNVPLSFTLVVTKKVTDVRLSVVNVIDVDDAVQERATASANGTIRAHDLSEILGEGLSFSEQILSNLKSKVEAWGIEIIAIEVKDFGINDVEIQQAISMKARAKKEAEGELVRAEMQQQIAQQLNEAAKTLDEGGWRLKSLEVLLELCRSAENNTILIPAELQSLARAFAPTNLTSPAA